MWNSERAAAAGVTASYFPYGSRIDSISSSIITVFKAFGHSS